MLVRFRSFRLSIHPSIHRHPEMSMVTWASPTAKRTRGTRLPWRGANPHRLIVPKKSSPNYPYPSDVENFEKLLKGPPHYLLGKSHHPNPRRTATSQILIGSVGSVGSMDPKFLLFPQLKHITTSRG